MNPADHRWSRVLGFVILGGLGFVFAGGGDRPARRRSSAPRRSARPARRETRAPRAPGRANDRRAAPQADLQTPEGTGAAASARPRLTLERQAAAGGPELSPCRSSGSSAAASALVVVASSLLVLRPTPLIGAAARRFARASACRSWVVGFLAERRTKKFTADFSDAIDIIVRGIKSGLPVHDCLKIIAQARRAAPLRAGIPAAGREHRHGHDRRSGAGEDVRAHAHAGAALLRHRLNIQQKTGGNLAEALGNLSAVLRSRKLMREKIKALSSEATASACIIGSLPPGVVMLITVTTPVLHGADVHRPARQADAAGRRRSGWALGIFVMRRMINFKF